ncbi:uncharacterized protein LOC108246770 [Kryptolebias marmoratus]|uniref:Uncharacterized LOC108246770 n=1 Tax=Kryptolebias marmoratus TaxID=37003 RepID=A0A3Q2ZL03_KRYMA|nr:uncharacterized protein LOC108246770 [Kryptolebias marmoratus]
MLGGLLVLFLAASVTAEIILYRKLGDDVDLKPAGISVTSQTKSITWKDGANKAVEWDGTTVDKYRHFKERADLNLSTGVMTIRRLVQNDSNTYTPDFGEKAGTPIKLIIISSVPVPTINQSPAGENQYKLTCDGDTTGAVPVEYTWMSDNNVMLNISGKDHIITEGSSDTKEFICEMKNPVSKESSQPIQNPLTISPAGNLKISTGVTVFVCLLLPVLLLVIIHRIKAGMWFFEKSSMPWEGDFWKKGESQHATASNGTSALPSKKQLDEETPMTD